MSKWVDTRTKDGDPERYARKLQLNKEYRARKKAGIKLDIVSKHKRAQPSKKEDFNAESYARKLAKNQEYRARKKAKDPVKYAAELREKQKDYWHNLPDSVRKKRVIYKREWRREKSKSAHIFEPNVPTGSVLATAAPSEWRDMMAYIVGKVGRCDEHEDIVSEACMLTLEGMPVDEAIHSARKKIRFELNAIQRNMVNIDVATL